MHNINLKKLGIYHWKYSVKWYSLLTRLIFIDFPNNVIFTWHISSSVCVNVCVYMLVRMCMLCVHVYFCMYMNQRKQVCVCVCVWSVCLAVCLQFWIILCICQFLSVINTHTEYLLFEFIVLCKNFSGLVWWRWAEIACIVVCFVPTIS